MDDLENRIRSLMTSSSRSYAPNRMVSGNLEYRTAEDRYHWDGLRRGGDPARPFLVFQVTLSGSGIYEVGGVCHRLPPGTAFAAVVPSAHRYFLPPDAPPWRFFWLILRHPYVVARIAELQRTFGNQQKGAVLTLETESPLLQQAISLFRGDFADHFDEELSLFQFLIEYERHVHRSDGASHQAGDALREAVRRFVKENLFRPVDVSELATAHRMTRSRFSHRFKELTGEPPARFVTRVRLEEATRRLAESDVPLRIVAEETGFADANHLVKVFRRHYDLSPGQFRRQMR